MIAKFLSDSIGFIDWEECGYTFAAFDIAVHFAWLAGKQCEHFVLGNSGITITGTKR